MSNNTSVEIELRYRVNDGDEVSKWLKQNADNQGCKEQCDVYYDHPGCSFFAKTLVSQWLRVRYVESKHFITYKDWKIDESGKSTDVADEYETEIESPEQIRKLLKSLGFNEIVTVEKSRETYFYNEFKILLDKVEGLGQFLEIESVNADEKPEKIKEQMRNIVEDIGGLEEPDDDVDLGYPYMLLKKEGKLEKLKEQAIGGVGESKIAELAQLIDKAEDEKLNVQNQLRRVLADYANLERDMDKRVDLAMTQSSKRAAKGIVSVLDDVNMAIEAKQDIKIDQETEAWLDGILTAIAKLKDTLSEMGIEAMEVKPGDDFNSMRHEALSVAQESGFKNNQIIKVLQDGYMLGDTVIRSARVIVNKV